MSKRVFVGYRKVEYVKKDGVEVKGYELYFEDEIDPDLGLGYRPAMRFLNKERAFRPYYISAVRFNKLNDSRNLTDNLDRECNILYDQYGSIMDITFD